MHTMLSNRFLPLDVQLQSAPESLKTKLLTFDTQLILAFILVDFTVRIHFLLSTAFFAEILLGIS